MNLTLIVILGAYVAGILTMGWIKSYQMKLVENERDEALAQRDEARKNQSLTVKATEEVLNAERTIDHSSGVPRHVALKLLLGDAKRETPGTGG